MRQTPSQIRGFTLVELMVVVAVIGILLALAIPAYNDYITRSNLVDATNQLSAYRAQMEQYYQDARQYTTTGAYTTPCPSNLTPSNSKWTYDCPAATLTTSTYTITAVGVSGTAVSGFKYSIDQANNQLTVTVPTTSWGAANTTHWIMKKGG